MKCRACGLDHSPLMRCEVAKRVATNKESDATNRCVVATNADMSGFAQQQVDERGHKAVASEVGAKTANRRTREAYNAYQREYMKRRRSGFIGIAYG